MNIIMSNRLFMKRILSNRIYWLAVLAAVVLLLCSIVYTDAQTGEKYTFLSMFYNEALRGAMESGIISGNTILLRYDSGYLWMFIPIIAGIPCMIIKKTERFALFRMGKNKYYMAKCLSTLLAGGGILVISYLAYAFFTMLALRENVWDILIVKKFFSVFCWGILSAIPSTVLSEFVNNKYLILCIPFVLNYFLCMFLGRLLPYEVEQYLSPYTYQNLFLYDIKTVIICAAILVFLIFLCMLMKKFLLEKRCDCGR